MEIIPKEKLHMQASDSYVLFLKVNILCQIVGTKKATLIIYKWCGYDLSRNFVQDMSKHSTYIRVWPHIVIHINELWVPHNFRFSWVQCLFDWPNTQII
jgi:hypothetical protein